MSESESGFYELKLFTENSALKKTHQEAAKKHNEKLSSDPHADSGYDLFTPETTTINSGVSSRISLQIKCALVYHTYKTEKPCGFYLYPRSSTGTKTPLRLANSVGIIDSGYRGEIQVAFDNISNRSYTAQVGSRLVQICSPTLEPFVVTVLDDESKLGETIRDSGGFGSTGK